MSWRYVPFFFDLVVNVRPRPSPGVTVITASATGLPSSSTTLPLTSGAGLGERLAGNDGREREDSNLEKWILHDSDLRRHSSTER